MLKLFRAGISETSVRHEAEATTAAYDLGFAVPAVGGVIEVDGRLGIIYERLQGPTLLQHFAAAPWRLVACARQLAELQVALHRCLAPVLPPLRPQLRRQIERAGGLDEPVKSRVLDRLEGLPDGDRLCRWDFHPDNVILTERGPYVIDWMGAARGDAAADLARTSVLFRTPQVPKGRAGERFGRLAIHLTYWAYRRRYLQLLPTSSALTTDWEVPVAAARLDESRPQPENARLRRLVLAGLGHGAA